MGFVGATTVSEGGGTYTARVALNHAGMETFNRRNNPHSRYTRARVR